ncbi:23S rRNA (cytidine(2498)-2'-O)-methyltransferase RlmM [Halomonas sp. McH1-25]|uniref:23S rRNA (cytidine(2498)-2'-O)-methyltransferase RlmM n=1 Tax=unclassified Halomonas TaxID=2609666 RepID=UPI001EF6C4F4|nr:MULTISPECIES: 23S rRNA (cytidine(2498)-2'-O)-methyltransferase RlmM [unclassified Halomonas]MCG7602043.1 23S rRNA (cytidine(2498)-2'-O)-methyltransferase RlmM [Halomonas sp. McH1-25]MCP1344442.1 23S rRNA (cytidine(2498)-2'-O)-methyltransferase RlmM [Halomonas sp. FL8]MCP1362288.1 23S rRNA (cytidine(2498)-2'-O)-methyltransferase RlmM [Halomonas sp. BBD45]
MAHSIANEIVFYCRPGFEADLSAELAEKASVLGLAGYPIAKPDSGYVRFIQASPGPANELHRNLPLATLVFARQSLLAYPPLESLSRDDRLTPIVQQVIDSGWSFEALWQETPDTNEGKALAGLGKALQKPLESLLRKRGALRRKAGGRRLHLFWSAGDTVQVAMSFPGNRSESPGGIHRLRFPREAPSRSTLKLEEAWHTFIAREEWSERLHDGMQAADLGAAPGGWTYQLVRQGMFVYAIDNGPMNEMLMATGQIEHLREDGFVWEPPYRLDWLVCDIVDKPMRVIDMVERWLARRWCREAVFNLKLPMKQRWQEVERCLVRLERTLAEANIRSQLQCKQLYHDREEVTVHVRLME